MASSSKLLILLSLWFFSSFMSMSTTMSRPLVITSTELSTSAAAAAPLFLTRLKLDEEETGINSATTALTAVPSSSCWESLFELQSCTGEVVLFFLNGQTYLGPNCCRAIRTIEHHCWPSMLGSVGIDTQEGDVLLGYCDSTAVTDTPDLPPSSPASPPLRVHHSNNVIPTTTTTITTP